MGVIAIPLRSILLTGYGAGTMKKFLGMWNSTEKCIAGSLGLITTGLAFTNTILRYVFKYSPEWMEEIIVYLIIWAAFIVASTLVEEKRHVGTTFLVGRLPAKMQRLVALVTSFLALGFCTLVLYLGYTIVHIAYVSDERSLTTMRYPLWIFYLSLPVGLSLMAARYGKKIYRLLFRFDSSDLKEH
jgi:C4-dicarboxylate transporter DctQ subunit